MGVGLVISAALPSTARQPMGMTDQQVDCEGGTRAADSPGGGWSGGGWSGGGWSGLDTRNLQQRRVEAVREIG